LSANASSLARRTARLGPMGDRQIRLIWAAPVCLNLTLQASN
jgi:hypothetical protein